MRRRARWPRRPSLIPKRRSAGAAANSAFHARHRPARPSKRSRVVPLSAVAVRAGTSQQSTIRDQSVAGRRRVRDVQSAACAKRAELPRRISFAVSAVAPSRRCHCPYRSFRRTHVYGPAALATTVYRMIRSRAAIRRAYRRGRTRSLAQGRRRARARPTPDRLDSYPPARSRSCPAPSALEVGRRPPRCAAVPVSRYRPVIRQTAPIGHQLARE